MKTFKRIGVLTSGGDAPGMNAAVRAVVLTLCSIEPVERVQLQLLGGAGLQYCAIDASIAPDSAWLE